MKRIVLAIAAILLCAASWGQTKTDKDGSVSIDGVVKLDRNVYDFGDIMLSDGPQEATFKVTNISSAPMAIYNVTSSCGCTNVKWTREPIAPGKSGTINVTYSNNEGPYPFNKTITVYFSNTKKPVVLRIRGYSHEKKQPLGELYPVHFGPLGMKSADIKCGNLSQGSQRSDRIIVANISSSPVSVSFRDVTPGMSISVSPDPIPANSTAYVSYTITADRSKWGKNYYYATPVVAGSARSAVEDGKKISRIGIWSFTKEDFSSLTQEQKENGAQPIFKESTYEFGKVSAGKIINAVFTYRNIGGETFKVYKADPDNPAATLVSALPSTAPKGTGSLTFRLDTSSLPKGDILVVVTLTTNSPLRPIVNLFISGAIA